MAEITRRSLLQSVGSAGAALLLAATWSNTARAKRKAKTMVTWTDVELPEAGRRRQRERILRSILKKESSRAEWGDHEGGRVEASVRVTEFTVSERADVVRVTCTAVGKLKNGPSVRTHFSFGDHPKKRNSLEKTVLTLVAQGVVTRLAAIARDRAARRK